MTKRRKLVAGNWKMHKSLDEARQLARAVAAGLAASSPLGPPKTLFSPLGPPKGTEGGPAPDVVIFPAFPFLTVVSEVVAEAVAKGGHPIEVGAQNVHPETEGAFTGEVSAAMIRSTGARWVLAGHSERRHLFGEFDEFVGRKVRAALDLGITPILCVGEKLEEREAGRTLEVVKKQLRAGLDRLEMGKATRVVIAYEPVWAIGTGKVATPAQGVEVHQAIRAEIGRAASPELAQGIRILYGGSVKPGNIRELLQEPEIDGVLVGGASLEAASFLELCRAGQELS